MVATAIGLIPLPLKKLDLFFARATRAEFFAFESSFFSLVMAGELERLRT